MPLRHVDGKVAVRGWLETSALHAIDVAKRHEQLPLAGIVYTDIAKDGMMAGPNLPALAAARHRLGRGVEGRR
ncbi:MAG: HisA/HisF-related TIM barrel protein, partial [Planctomycetia bacterium]